MKLAKPIFSINVCSQNLSVEESQAMQWSVARRDTLLTGRSPTCGGTTSAWVASNSEGLSPIFTLTRVHRTFIHLPLSHKHEPHQIHVTHHAMQVPYYDRDVDFDDLAKRDPDFATISQHGKRDGFINFQDTKIVQ